MITTPVISVILPVYNADRFVGEAISSILNQSFSDFELIIINDGSFDASESVVKSFTDERIVFLNNDVNKGLIYSLNLGICCSRGKYLIRMDADDVCFSDRCLKQFNFMELNSDVVVSGGQMEDYDKKSVTSKVETNSDKLKASLLFSCVLSHPTVIMRADIIKSQKFLYDESFPHSEDYELWSRVCRSFKIANLEDVILRYRFHSQQVSKVFSHVQVDGMKRCQKMQFKAANFSFSDVELDMHSKIARLNFENTRSFFVAANLWFIKLYRSPELNNVYNKNALKNVIGCWYYNLTGELLNAKTPIKRNILLSPLTYRSLDISQFIKLMIKIIVK